MEHCNELLDTTKFEAPLGTYQNSPEATKNCQNSYYSVISMMLYLLSNTISDIVFNIHQYEQCTHNTNI